MSTAVSGVAHAVRTFADAAVAAERAARAALFERTLRCLRVLYGVRVMPWGATAWMVLRRDRTQAGLDHYWVLADNGGECGLWRPNRDALTLSVPYDTATDGLLDGGTLAYRLVQIMDGDAIDYAARWPDDESLPDLIDAQAARARLCSSPGAARGLLTRSGVVA